jgi:hypothetical protein
VQIVVSGIREEKTGRFKKKSAEGIKMKEFIGGSK